MAMTEREEIGLLLLVAEGHGISLSPCAPTACVTKQRDASAHLIPRLRLQDRALTLLVAVGAYGMRKLGRLHSFLKCIGGNLVLPVWDQASFRMVRTVEAPEKNGAARQWFAENPADC